MPLNWYLAPVCTSEEHGAHPLHPNGCAEFIPGIICQAYDVVPPDPEDPEWSPTCLVGTSGTLSLVGWTSMSHDDAEAHFEVVVGRAPTDEEMP